MQSVQSLLNKLYLPNGHVGLLRRLTGVWLLGILPLELHYCFYELPYRVPGLRFGMWTLDLPAFPVWLDGLLWFAYALSAIWLVMGSKSRPVALVPAIVLLYFGSQEVWAFTCSFTIMLFIYLVAFSLYREPVSCTRRIIQFGISTCYFYAAASKCFPEFLSGNTLNEILNKGWMLKQFWHPLMSQFTVPPLLLTAMAVAAAACEAFVAFGLWFRKTRKYAAAVGILLHCGIFLFIADVDVFAPVMLTGYLAFFDKGSDSQTQADGPVARHMRYEQLLAAAFLAVMLWLPFRFYIPDSQGSGLPFDRLSYFDHGFWGWAMFMFHEQLESVRASYFAGQEWHDFPCRERMTRASSKDEMLALARYILRQHPEAEIAKVETKLRFNDKRVQTKTCIYSRSETGIRQFDIDDR